MALDKDTRATPQELFDDWDNDVNFTIDVAASATNTKCKRFYDEEQDGLLQSWGGERVWCNPPYSEIPKWVEKAHNERDAEFICMLIPANRTEQPFWQEFIEPNRDRGGRLYTCFLSKRIRFIHPETGLMGSPMFGCVMLVWRRDE
jgi:hypothetical protein